jgi:hypothetical protein
MSFLKILGRAHPTNQAIYTLFKKIALKKRRSFQRRRRSQAGQVFQANPSKVFMN